MGSSPSKKRKEVLLKISIVSAMKPKEKDQNENHKQVCTVAPMVEARKWSIHRASIRTEGHRLSYGDTTTAWNALRHTLKQYQRKISKSSLNQFSTFQKQASFGSEAGSSDSFYEKNPNLLYNAAREIKRMKECYICKVEDSRKDPLHACRVCIRVYHHFCLETRGHLSDQLSLAAAEESDTNVGWSCPTCENLLNLLHEDEQTEVIESFEKMAGNETSVDADIYLAKRRSSYFKLVGIPMTSQREKQEVSFFDQMDRNRSGTLEWWEYVPTMCVRILSRRTQEELLEITTALEISRLEKFFKAYDRNKDGLITFTAAKMAYGKWLLSLIKQKEDSFIPEEWIGELPEEWIGINSSNRMYQAKQKKETVVSWQDFLLVNALHIICARPNTVCTRPLLPTIDDALCFLNVGREIPLEEDIEEDLEDESDPILKIKRRLKNN